MMVCWGVDMATLTPQKEQDKAAPVDYCGSKGSEGVPDGIWGGACKTHDDCYGSPGGNKKKCDINLGFDIYDECVKRSSRLLAGVCSNIGEIYTGALLLLGVTPFWHPSKDAFDAGQRGAVPLKGTR